MTDTSSTLKVNSDLSFLSQLLHLPSHLFFFFVTPPSIFSVEDFMPNKTKAMQDTTSEQMLA